MKASVIYDNCINCQICMSGCPVNAIIEDEGHAKVIYSECIFCGNCIDNCPVNAIEEKE